MEFKFLKKNEIYYIEYFNGKYKYILKHDNDNKCFNYINIIDGEYFIHTSFSREDITILRKATGEEKHWLEECIKVSKFISKEEALKTFAYEYKVVHCKTELEWNFVIDKLQSKVPKNAFGTNNCLCFDKLEHYCHCPLEFYQRNNSLILSFEEWCTKFGHVFNKIPEYVEGIGDSKYIKKGNIYEVDLEISEGWFRNGITIKVDETGTPCRIADSFVLIKPSTKEAYDAQFKTDEKMFKKDDYVVVMKSTSGNSRNEEMVNYCFKLLPGPHYPSYVNCFVKDFAKSNFYNGDGGYWIKPEVVRKATDEEIKHYNIIGKPYDIRLPRFTEFALPEKWCIKPKNEEEDKVLINWRGCGYIGARYSSWLTYNKYWAGDKIGYTEITFEQFKKYVLKEEPKEHSPKFKVGDKVRFISSSSSNAKYFEKGLENLEIYRVGKVYSVYESDKSDIWKVREDELELQTTPSNFIVGKWSVMVSSGDKYYIKVTKIGEGKIDGDTIQFGRYESGDYWSSSTFLKEARVLTDLSEIQDLLPDGHVDKIKKEITMTYEEITRNVGKYVSFYWGSTFIDKALIHKENGGYYLLNNVRSGNDGHKDRSVYKYAYYLSRYEFERLSAVKFIESPVSAVTEKEFIKGKWYKHLGSSKTVYGKYERHDGSRYIWLTEWISSSGSYGSGGRIEFDSIELADMTEISKYLPKGHKDRIEDPEQYLLEEAKRRYPSGTTYKNLGFGGQIFTVDTQDFQVRGKDLIWAEGGKGILYTDGQWAPVISTEAAKIKTERKRVLPPQEAPIYEVKKVKVIKRTQD